MTLIEFFFRLVFDFFHDLLVLFKHYSELM